MSTKQPKSSYSKSGSKSTSANSARGTQSKPAATRISANVKPPTSEPETVLRYSGDVFCVICLPKGVAEHLGPELTEKVLKNLNEIGLRICMQDAKAVVNLRAPIFASVF